MPGSVQRALEPFETTLEVSRVSGQPV
jgi:hypothetical protein